MDVRELRIGNYFQSKLGVLHEVILIDRNFIVGDCAPCYDENDERISFDNLADVCPVPLSEEWLVKFGFRSIAHLGNCVEITSTYSNARIEFDDGKVFLVGTDDEKIGKQINYVHELQNLIFSLTGSELEVK